MSSTPLLRRHEAPESDPSSAPRDADRSSERPTRKLRARGAAGIREALRCGRLVDDHAFDLLYPEPIRRVPRVHWTPVEVAVRAARLLADRPRLRLLDIGSGVGKFCIVAAASVDASVTGVDPRPHLTKIARGGQT